MSNQAWEHHDCWKKRWLRKRWQPSISTQNLESFKRGVARRLCICVHRMRHPFEPSITGGSFARLRPTAVGSFWKFFPSKKLSERWLLIDEKPPYITELTHQVAREAGRIQNVESISRRPRPNHAFFVLSDGCKTPFPNACSNNHTDKAGLSLMDNQCLRLEY